MDTERKEVNSKDIFLGLKQWFRFFLSKWILLFVAGLICGIIAVVYVWNQKPKYTASLSFILSNTSSGSSGLYGLASQFGLDFSSNTDAFSGDNIISLMNSRTMVQKALLQKPHGYNETLINIFIKDGKANDAWNKIPRLKGSYPFPDDPGKMSFVQDSLFRDLYQAITTNYLNVSRPDKNLSEYIVTTKSHNEIFSLYLTKFLVEATSRFYIDTKTSVARANLNMLQHESDSIHTILRGSISSTARANDYTYNLNPAYQAQRVPAQEAQLTGTALSAAYSEVLRNLELAKINLQKETPLYQILDEPQLPLVAEKTSRLIALILGCFAGAFIMMAYLVFRKFFLHTN